MEPKPFKSIDEQIHILQDRGMIIDDASRARNALETIGYYKLSGYSYPFRRKREGTNEIADEFTEGTTFEEVLAVYSYDETLREATAHELSRTEIAFRALIGHELGKTAPHLHLMPHELGPKAWDKDHARPTEEYRRWIEHYQTQLGTSDEDSVLHYKLKYRGAEFMASLPKYTPQHLRTSRTLIQPQLQKNTKAARRPSPPRLPKGICKQQNASQMGEPVFSSTNSRAVSPTRDESGRRTHIA